MSRKSNPTLGTHDGRRRATPRPLGQLVAAALLALGTLSSAPAAEMVNVNAADAATLAEMINGVGMSKAKAIVAYREAHGPFASIDDLVAVPGIGERTIERNRDRLALDYPAAEAEAGAVAAEPAADALATDP